MMFTGRYVWSESHKVANYVDWANNQPNNAEDANCVFKAVSREEVKGWHDAPCTWTVWSGHTLELHALCETGA